PFDSRHTKTPGSWPAFIDGLPSTTDPPPSATADAAVVSNIKSVRKKGLVMLDSSALFGRPSVRGREAVGVRPPGAAKRPDRYWQNRPWTCGHRPIGRWLPVGTTDFFVWTVGYIRINTYST